MALVAPRACRKHEAGHFAKAGVEAGGILKEFRLDAARAAEFAAGSVIAVESVFEAGQLVDVHGHLHR